MMKALMFNDNEGVGHSFELPRPAITISAIAMSSSGPSAKYPLVPSKSGKWSIADSICSR